MRPIQFIQLVNLQARMNLKAEASKLYLSYLWWIIEPILFALTFYFVFEVLLQFGRGENFLFFLMCGKVPYLWFSKAVMGGSNSIVGGRGLIHQVNMPKALFPYTSVQDVLYKQWAVFLVLFAMAAFFGYMPSLHWLWLVPLMIVQYLLILLCAMVGAYLVSFVRDVRMLIQMGMMFLMFSSGVFWDVSRISNVELREALLTWNPLAFLLDAYRQVIMHNALYDLQHLGVLCAVVLTGLLLVHGLYRAHSQLIAAKVMNS